MKGKPINYVLILAFVAVWGLVIFRMVGGEEPEIALPSPSDLLAAPTGDIKVPDQVELLVNYEDPFLRNGKRGRPHKRSAGSSSQSGRGTTRNVPGKVVTPPLVTNVEPTNQWPEVAFVGLIRNEARPSKVVLLSINDEDAILTEGDSIKGMKLTAVYNDSVLLARGETSKVIRAAW